MVRAYEAGEKGFRLLARQFGVCPSTCRRAVVLARRKGIEAVERLPDSVKMGKRYAPKYSEEEYRVRALGRLLAMLEPDANGCWRYRGTHTPTGYGIFGYRRNGRAANQNAHRVMYEFYHGVTLAKEQYVLHRCDVRDCCNPDHLWIGTAKDNNADCAKKGRHYRGTRTHCPQGHEYNEENTYWTPSKASGLARNCKACARERHRTPEYRAKALERQRRRRAERRNAV